MQYAEYEAINWQRMAAIAHRRMIEAMERGTSIPAMIFYQRLTAADAANARRYLFELLDGSTSDPYEKARMQAAGWLMPDAIAARGDE